MKMLQFSSKKVGIDSDHKRPNPHANKQVCEGLFGTTLGTEGTETSCKEGDTQGSPHIPLFSNFLIIPFTRHGDLDLIKNVVQISSLHDNW